MLIAVNFHYVRPSFETPFPSIHGVTPGALDAQLEALSEVASFASPEEVREAVSRGEPFGEPTVLVTFDDGLREQFQHAVPVLEEREVPAAFFVNTAPVDEGTLSTVHRIHLVRAHSEPDWVVEEVMAAAGGAASPEALPADRVDAAYPYDEPAVARLKYLLNFVLEPERREDVVARLFRARFGDRERALSEELYMDPDQMRELAGRGWLGSHGHEHRPLGLLGAGEQARMFHEAGDLLETWTGRRPFAFSYPFGSHDACRLADASVPRDAGVAFAFTMERAGNRTLEGPLHLARFDCNDVPGGKAPRFGPADVPDGVPRRTWHRDAAPADAPDADPPPEAP